MVKLITLLSYFSKCPNILALTGAELLSFWPWHMLRTFAAYGEFSARHSFPPDRTPRECVGISVRYQCEYQVYPDLTASEVCHTSRTYAAFFCRFSPSGYQLADWNFPDGYALAWEPSCEQWVFSISIPVDRPDGKLAAGSDMVCWIWWDVGSSASPATPTLASDQRPVSC